VEESERRQIEHGVLSIGVSTHGRGRNPGRLKARKDPFNSSFGQSSRQSRDGFEALADFDIVIGLRKHL
jgi:hypothetical protein